jgi:hypothetical protein
VWCDVYTHTRLVSLPPLRLFLRLLVRWVTRDKFSQHETTWTWMIEYFTNLNIVSLCARQNANRIHHVCNDSTDVWLFVNISSNPFHLTRAWAAAAANSRWQKSHVDFGCLAQKRCCAQAELSLFFDTITKRKFNLLNFELYIDWSWTWFPLLPLLAVAKFSFPHYLLTSFSAEKPIF